jgi:hypothetical protein
LRRELPSALASSEQSASWLPWQFLCEDLLPLVCERIVECCDLEEYLMLMLRSFFCEGATVAAEI